MAEEGPIPIDVQLFSGFLSAIVSFSEKIYETNVRNIDFMNARFSFYKNPTYMLIVRTSIQRPLERTLQQLNNLDQELIHDPKVIQLLNDPDFRKLPLQIYELHISKIFTEVMEQGFESERRLRQIDLMAIIQAGKETLQLISYLTNNTRFKDFLHKGITSDIILKYILSDEPVDFLNLPDLPYSDFTPNFRSFLNKIVDYVISEGIRPSESQMNELRIKVINFLSQSYRVLKYFNLDDMITTRILPLFN